MSRVRGGCFGVTSNPGSRLVTSCVWGPGGGEGSNQISGCSVQGESSESSPVPDPGRVLGLTSKPGVQPMSPTTT